MVITIRKNDERKFTISSLLIFIMTAMMVVLLVIFTQPTPKMTQNQNFSNNYSNTTKMMEPYTCEQNCIESSEGKELPDNPIRRLGTYDGNKLTENQKQVCCKRQDNYA